MERVRGGHALIGGDVDTTEELIVAISMGFTQDVLSQMDIANWAGYLTGYRKVRGDAVAHARACTFVKHNVFVVAWNGIVNGCCWDFEMRHRLGHILSFGDIQHTPPYELCPCCIWIHSDEAPH